MNKIALFADIQNIYYTTRQAYGHQFDYRKLWQQVSAKGEIVLANAYAIDRGDAQQHKFQQALKHIGFTIKLKPYIQRSDGLLNALKALYMEYVVFLDENRLHCMALHSILVLVRSYLIFLLLIAS